MGARRAGVLPYSVYINFFHTNGTYWEDGDAEEVFEALRGNEPWPPHPWRKSDVVEFVKTTSAYLGYRPIAKSTGNSIVYLDEKKWYLRQIGNRMLLIQLFGPQTKAGYRGGHYAELWKLP